MKNIDPIKMLMRMKNVDQIFDFICFHNYMKGQFDQKIPTDESRKVFERIKKLLRN